MKVTTIFICIFAVVMLLLCLGVVIYSTFINYTLWYIPVIFSIPLVVALLFVLNHHFDFQEIRLMQIKAVLLMMIRVLQ